MSLNFGDGSQNGPQKLINGYLKIVKVTIGDRGLYTCVAENKNGKTQSTTNVTIVGEYFMEKNHAYTCINSQIVPVLFTTSFI